MPLLNRVEAAAGDIDSSFGVDGKVTTKFPGGFSQGNGLVIQNDGKIVAGGSNSGSGRSDFAIARYNTDGSLDSTFGSNGKLTPDFQGSSSALYALALQPDGKIIGASSAGDITDFALVRYNTDGNLDTTFGAGGRVITDFGSFEFARAVAIQADGKIVAAGETLKSSRDFAIARYNPDGTVD